MIARLSFVEMTDIGMLVIYQDFGSYTHQKLYCTTAGSSCFCPPQHIIIRINCHENLVMDISYISYLLSQTSLSAIRLSIALGTGLVQHMPVYQDL